MRKTDEENVESYVDVLDELRGKPYYISAKIDGTSSTFYIKDNVFGVCSRNLDMKEDENNGYWKISKKYDIENKLKLAYPNKNIGLQGEIFGEGVQGNLLGISGIDIALFNIYDIDNKKYANFGDLISFSEYYKVPMVDIIEKGDNFNKTLKELQEMSNNLKYKNGNIAEGIVVRPKIEEYSNVLRGRLSFKVRSELFKLKYD